MPGKPGPHPDPPPDFAERDPLIAEASQRWFRIHRIERDPIYFGREPNNRFDAPDGSYGVLYLGADEYVCFVETLGYKDGARSIAEADLGRFGLARITTSRPLRLIDLFSSGGLVRAGADGRLSVGDHECAQRWSAAFHAHPVQPEGILYPARHDTARAACALFDACAPALIVERLGPLNSPELADLVGSILDHYHYALI